MLVHIYNILNFNPFNLTRWSMACQGADSLLGSMANPVNPSILCTIKKRPTTPQLPLSKPTIHPATP